ncbi:MAG: hypothetical protein COA84_13835 [Robiginitomaculum sp.]|nr:MAG: hypothetical protein COA84_13835 [Robiginitomaculum sp.]
MNGIELILQERQRQIDVEGWSAEHDDAHNDGSLIDAAMAYLRNVNGYKISRWVDFLRQRTHVPNWPETWARGWYKPESAIRDLVKSGALIAAEIDRLQRRTENKG